MHPVLAYTLYFREEDRRLKAIQAEEAIIASWKRQQDEILRQMQVIEQMQKLKKQNVRPPYFFWSLPVCRVVRANAVMVSKNL